MTIPIMNPMLTGPTVNIPKTVASLLAASTAIPRVENTSAGVIPKLQMDRKVPRAIMAMNASIYLSTFTDM